MKDYFVFNAGNVVLQSGITFREAKLAYQTYGHLNGTKSNAILYMTSFSAHHYDVDWMVGPGKALDTDKYFVIIPNLFGNGLSSSPSNAVEPFNGSRWPNFTIADNVAIQQRMLTQQFGIDVLQLACGWSMGGLQAYHWGRALSGSGEAIGRAVRSGKDIAAQSGIHRRDSRDAYHGPGFSERHLRAAPRTRAAGHGTQLCGNGDVADVLS